MTILPTKIITSRLTKAISSRSFLATSTSHNYIHQLDYCSNINHLEQIQASITTSGLLTSSFLLVRLVELFSIKFHRYHHAILLFSSAPQPQNLFTWNTIIKAFSSGPWPQNALNLFALMLQTSSVTPDTFTYASALKACSLVHAHKLAKGIHALAIVSGYQSSSHIATTQLHAYASCGDVLSAREVFDKIPVMNVVSWNAMISGYVQNGLLDEALKLFCQMWSAGVGLNDVTVIAALCACARCSDLFLGRQIHGHVSKRAVKFVREVKLGTALINMYAKCGDMAMVKQVFSEMKSKDIGVWNALLGGYVYNGFFAEALSSFKELQASGMSPDEPTLVSVLSACTHLGMLSVGKSIHLCVEHKFPHLNASLGTALIDMYAKSGCIEESWEVFNKMPKKDVMAWTSMISALALHGYARDALELFSSMLKCGMKPDRVTFVNVLFACSHAGLVDEGIYLFKSMKKDYGIDPGVEHYGCMIDLLSRAGWLSESLRLIDSMEIQANPVIWRSLLSACRTTLDVELAEIAVKELRKLRSDHCGDYVLLSNIYAAKERWDDARRIRRQMEEMEIRKKLAFSLI